MAAPWIPRPPELLGPWRALLVEALPGVAIGPKRPADITNLSAPFVRISCLGGPWRQVGLWYPRLVTESWAPDRLQARELDATVAYVTARMEGLREDAFTITACDLDSQGQDAEVDGSPVVITQASLCVQVKLQKEKA